MIQLISNHHKFKSNHFDIKRISNPNSLDQYEVNIIDLNDLNIWRYKGKVNTTINSINDLKSIGRMLKNSRKAYNIIIFPQDQLFKYYQTMQSDRTNDYNYKIRLKDMLSILTDSILSKMTPISFRLEFENTQTKINNQIISSSFYFNMIADDYIITKSVKSDKATTISYDDKLFWSTLNLTDEENIKSLLFELGLVDEKEKTPDWIEEVDFYDDEEQNKRIKESQKKIDELDETIYLSENRLKENLKYKSILYTNGDELVEVILEILAEIFDYSFDSFVDQKQEDFVAILEEITFIGEIKGVSSNVKSQNVSQLDVHYQGYLDDISDDSQEKTKALLLINHQRNKNIRDREPIHQKQIDLAERNGSLIVETHTLLDLFGKYKKEDISREEIVSMLTEETGLLEI